MVGFEPKTACLPQPNTELISKGTHADLSATLQILDDEKKKQKQKNLTMSLSAAYRQSTRDHKVSKMRPNSVDSSSWNETKC